MLRMGMRREEGEGEPLFRHIRKDGEVRETILLASTLRLLGEGKVKITDGSVYDGDRVLDGPIDLTKDVERALQRGDFREAQHGL